MNYLVTGASYSAELMIDGLIPLRQIALNNTETVTRIGGAIEREAVPRMTMFEIPHFDPSVSYRKGSRGPSLPLSPDLSPFTSTRLGEQTFWFISFRAREF
jgi:hypothetical protein